VLASKEYKWECQGAKPGKKKGRAATGISEIFGIDILGYVYVDMFML
jgi:hypothetical protein